MAHDGQAQAPNVYDAEPIPASAMAEIERLAIQAALRDTGGNRRKAADLLGIGERTLYRKLREYEGEDGVGGEEGDPRDDA